jgi:Family of unknown function (DUF5681)
MIARYKPAKLRSRAGAKAKRIADEVGYGRPPRDHQFKPGHSGNPKGRPKGSRPAGAVLQDILQQKVTITERGKTRRIPVLELIFRRLVNDAIRSDPKAIKLLLSLVDRYAELPQTSIKFREMLAEDQAILAQYLREPASLIPDPGPTSDDEDRFDDV